MSSANQKIPCILWKLKIHGCAHNSPPLLAILNQTNPVYTVPFSPFMFHLNSMVSPTPRPCKWSLFPRFSNHIEVGILNVHRSDSFSILILVSSPGRRLLHRGTLIHKMLSNEELLIILRHK